MAKNPGIKVIHEQTGNWKRDEGKTIMENWLPPATRSTPSPANNDEMALGAIMAIKAASKLGKIPSAASTPARRPRLHGKGELNITVFQDANGQGEGGVEAAYLSWPRSSRTARQDDIIWIPYQTGHQGQLQVNFMK